MFRAPLLTAVAAVALLTALPVRAEDASAPSGQETAFSQALKGIKSWFGTPSQPTAPAATDTANSDDSLQVPPALKGGADGLQNIEPAAGSDDDMLQVPPQYTGPQSNAAPARGTSFDGAASVAAFKDNQEPSAADMAKVAPAAGGTAAPDMSKVDCDAIRKAADAKDGAEEPDAELVEACSVPTDDTAPAQPAFEPGKGAPQALPATQPAAGEPPIGEAVMPGEKTTGEKK